MYFHLRAIKNIPIRGGLCILFEGARRGTRMANQPTSSDNGSRAAVASYVASMSADLATMSKRTGLETLSFLLEMVRLEAESAGSQSNGRR
jgi:hypothetical protein